MPKYFFSYVEDNQESEIGEASLPNEEGAYAMALQYAGDALSSWPAKPIADFTMFIDVSDELGVLLFSVAIVASDKRTNRRSS